jgi:sodium/hydrogen exchanger 8
MTAGEIFKTILSSFFGTVVVSVLIGVLTALLCSYLFKKCRFLVESEVTQVAFTYIFGIMSYVIAEFFDMSGVITVLISGVTLAHYNYYNLTVGGMHATT